MQRMGPHFGTIQSALDGLDGFDRMRARLRDNARQLLGGIGSLLMLMLLWSGRFALVILLGAIAAALAGVIWYFSGGNAPTRRLRSAIDRLPRRLPAAE